MKQRLSFWGVTFVLAALVVFVAQGAEAADDFTILNASYSAGEKKINVTKKLTGMIENGTLTVTVSDDLADEELPPGDRLLVVVYRFKGSSKVAQVKLNETLTIPGDDEETPAGRAFVMFTEVNGPLMHEAYIDALRTARIEAKNRRVRALVIEIDTPGGRLDIAEKMVGEIQDVEDMPVIAWVKGQGALSAGVWVALACDKVVISPGAIIGASTPYHITEGVADVVEEKFLSALRAQYAAAARVHGRPGALAEAMVDPSLEVWEVNSPDGLKYVRADQATGEDRRNRQRTISTTGKLLSVHAEDALKLGIADALVEDDDVITAASGVADLGTDPLTYRKSLLAERSYARAIAVEEKLRREEEQRQAELEKRWRAEWERLRKAEAGLQVLDPARHVYEVTGEDHHFADDGKVWRERSEKAIEEADKCIKSLKELMNLVEKLARDDEDAQKALSEMDRYLQELRVLRRRIEEQKDRKGLGN